MASDNAADASVGNPIANSPGKAIDSIAKQIDIAFSQESHWVVLHDLNVSHEKGSVAIDHLLINRRLECYVLKSQSFRTGIRIGDAGQFERWEPAINAFELVPSPLEQAQQDIAILRDIMTGLKRPTRFGIPVTPSFHVLIVIPPGAKIVRPNINKRDTRFVVRSDRLKNRIDEMLNDESPFTTLTRTARRLISFEALESFAERLAALDQRRITMEKPIHAMAAPSTLTEATAISLPTASEIASPTSAEATPVEPVEAVLPETVSLEPVEAALPAPEITSPLRAEATSSEPIITTTPTAAVVAPSPAEDTSPTCSHCGTHQGRIVYDLDYVFKCGTCGTRSSIRIGCKPGHRPRLRKHGQRFYRDCTQCGTSDLYYENVIA